MYDPEWRDEEVEPEWGDDPEIGGGLEVAERGAVGRRRISP
jgi:hypothetical protein